ncbi:MAG TPA: MBL fold metallo-hydrolase [Candidatus Dormibacteraeota bacterium]|nr:MBL fold metallo-hydrolase [Candidatus Dormibacteraeota bacterium]
MSADGRCQITYIGGPTALIEIGSIRLLTDPTFDPAGGKYSFGFGTGSRKTAGPAIKAEDIGALDAILLSHDQHDDNLDAGGREILAGARTVLTTLAAERRLKENAVGLRNWETARVVSPDGQSVTVTAMPARHGNMGVAVLSGPAIGFLLEWPGQAHGGLYITGDTVYFGGLAEIGQRFKVSAGIFHFGSVRFPISGPARFTMNAAEGVRLAQTLALRTVVPMHFEDWAHFRESPARITEVFAAAGEDGLLHWPQRGEAIEIEV